MCNLHFIRKRNRASCTYAVAGPEQLPNYEVKKTPLEPVISDSGGVFYAA